MKSMSELIQSVKDEKLKKVAEDLKEKLSNVGRIITEKRKKGEQVTENESASLKKSLSGYVKKGLSATLVSAMLASMLSGCDVLLTEVERGTGEIETAVAESTSDSMSPKEKFDEIYNVEEGDDNFRNEVYRNGLDEEYGMVGILSEVNFEELLTESKYSDYLDQLYSTMLQRCQSGEAFDEPSMQYYERFVAAIGQVANGEKGATVLTSETDEWKNLVLISTQNFAIRTENKTTGKLYLTGFANGEFKNDLKIVDESVVALANSMLQDNEEYTELVGGLQKEFWGMILRDALDPDSKVFSGNIEMAIDLELSRSDGKVAVDTRLKSLNFIKEGEERPTSMIRVETNYMELMIKQYISDVRAQQIRDNANQELN